MLKASTYHLHITNESAMLELGSKIAQLTQPGSLIFLQGELGAGKTTFTRGFLRGLGHLGLVKSPTYTLVETYDLNGRQINHFDLYRITDFEELEYIGLSDYLVSDAICLIEWPEHVASHLPEPLLWCKISVPISGEGRDVELITRSETIAATLETWNSTDESLENKL